MGTVGRAWAVYTLTLSLPLFIFLSLSHTPSLAVSLTHTMMMMMMGLQGLAGLLASRRPPCFLFVEISEELLQAQGSSAVLLIRYLHDQGYEVHI